MVVYDYTVMHVLRQEADIRRQNAEIIATVHGGYAPMKQKRLRRWMSAQLQMLRGRSIAPVRIDPQTPYTKADMDAANMAGD